MPDVVVLGSINLDLVANAPRLPVPGETILGDRYREFAGGKGLNQAVAAARAGASVALVAAVGDDEAGTRLRRVAAEEGIDVSSVQVLADVETGRALITVDAAGENSIVVVPGANARTMPALPSPAPAVVVLAQLEVPLAVVVETFVAARAAGSTTVLNPAPAVSLPDELLAVTDIVVPNEHEADRLGGGDALLARGVGAVVVTRGAHGVVVHDGDTVWRQPASEVEAVDTTGAGDAFCGVLAARLAAGDPLAEAVRWAAAAGACATTVAGAVASLPTQDRIRSLLDAGP